jgi:hypothetical protein
VKVKAWTHGMKGEPYYPSNYEITRSDILQWTDVMSNHNKYYSIEQHVAEERYAARALVQTSACAEQ